MEDTAAYQEEYYPEEHHQQYHEHAQQEHTVTTLLAWHAPGRPFIARSKEYYATALLIALLLEILCFFFAQYMLMLLIAAFLFATFALTSVPPHNFHYKISTQGITIEDHFFLWQELYDFYFKKINGVEVLLVRTVALIPGELTLTTGDIPIDHVKTILLPYLPFREVVKPPPMEKIGHWLAKTFPLERKNPPSGGVAS